jgi:hypothetical protein
MPGITPVSISSTAYADFGMDPTEKKLSVLRQNNSEVGNAWTAALTRPTAFGFPLYRMFSAGFNLGDGVHKLFNNQTQHFNVTPRDLTQQNVDGIVSFWQPKIDTLRGDVQQLFRDGEITNAQLATMTGTLDRVQSVSNQLKGLSGLFTQYPNPKKITVDIP